MSDELPNNLRPIADFFGLPGTASVAKDFYVVRAIKALAAVDGSPLKLIFAGGTALARAHRLVRRMSEDVDFKVILPAAATLSRNGQRKRLGALYQQVTDALITAGFINTPTGRGGDENRYAVWNVPYEARSDAGEGLRPAIKIELTFARLRLPSVTLPVSSFVAEALEQPPEVTAIDCVSLAETAAEKLISLTRRTAMALAGLGPPPDPTLVRHIYDLDALARHVDASAVIELARDIARTDGVEFRNQYPAYADDSAAETRKALDELRRETTRRRYDSFVAAMVYGGRPEFDVALATVIDWTEWMLRDGN